MVFLVAFLQDILSQAQVDTFSTVAGLILSGLLVVLYFRQSSIQSKQADIMARQEELGRVEKQPDIQVEAYRPGEGPGNHSIEPLELLLSNIGPTPGYDLQIEIVTAFDENSPLEGARTTHPLSRKEEEEEEGWIREWGTYLEPTTSKEIFTAEPLMISWIDSQSGNTGSTGLGLAANRLPEKHNGQIRLRYSVIYHSFDDQEHQAKIFEFDDRHRPFTRRVNALVSERPN